MSSNYRHAPTLITDLDAFLQRNISRRNALKFGVASAGLAATFSGAVNAACVSQIPSETAGPFPADGGRWSNVNALLLDGIVRRNLRTSLGTGNVAEGEELTVNLQLVNVNPDVDCLNLEGYVVYIWHCNRDGGYSLYDSGIRDEDYLRGVQVADNEGKLSFVTTFPACYSQRWPHMHFEIYPSLSLATSAANKVHTSQLAFPEDVCNDVYTKAPGYAKSARELARMTLPTDYIFRDGVSQQMTTMTGNMDDGYTATLVVGIDANNDGVALA